jgi:pyridoxamine 5'-phosphate oxidase
MLALDELKTRDFTLADDPFALFGAWQDAAIQTEPNDPIAMALATVDPDGLPDVRMVLCKGWDERGFVFYTNIESAKGRELGATMKAAALFHWKSQRKQIRIRGPVAPVSDMEADAYFASRPRKSQIGAWASLQSRPLSSRAVLEDAVADVEAGYPQDVPRPPYWTGFRILPLQIEFWSDGAYRLHDRIVFKRDGLEEGWTKTRLYP